MGPTILWIEKQKIIFKYSYQMGHKLCFDINLKFDIQTNEGSTQKKIKPNL